MRFTSERAMAEERRRLLRECLPADNLWAHSHSVGSGMTKKILVLVNPAAGKGQVNVKPRTSKTTST